MKSVSIQIVSYKSLVQSFIPYQSQKWHTVGIDLVGPLPETKQGNKYVVTVCDYFSKWPDAAPLPSKEATGVASFLLNTFCRHGWPKIVISDQGWEFVNDVNSYHRNV